MKSFDNFRFIRLFWEVLPKDISFPEGWVRFAKGGEVSEYHGPMHLVLNRTKNGAELDAVNLNRNGSTAQARQASSFWGCAGCTYSRRSKYFAIRVLPLKCVFSDKGPAVLPNKNVSTDLILAWLNSSPVRALIHFQANASDYLTGIIKTLPFPSLSLEASSNLKKIGRNLVDANRMFHTRDERDPEFHCSMWANGLQITFENRRLELADQANLCNRMKAEASSIVAESYGVDNLTWNLDSRFVRGGYRRRNAVGQ